MNSLLFQWISISLFSRREFFQIIVDEFGLEEALRNVDRQQLEHTAQQ